MVSQYVLPHVVGKGWNRRQSMWINRNEVPGFFLLPSLFLAVAFVLYSPAS